MKYISLAILLVAMKLSWGLVHSHSRISEGTHVGIQDDLKTIISDYLAKNLPTAKNLQFEKMWTEATKKENQIKASFIYSFDDEKEASEAARIKIEGFAILNQVKNDAEQKITWSFDELYIQNNSIEFQKGTVLSPNSANE